MHLCLDYLKERGRGTECETIDYVLGRDRGTD